jgi:hypothetical protein
MARKSVEKNNKKKKTSQTVTAGVAAKSPNESRSPEPSSLDPENIALLGRRTTRRKGIGPMSAGQAGDLQGLSREDSTEMESVAELAAEGQAREAEVLEGIEAAETRPESEVRTREVPADDVPREYTDGQY